MNKMVKKGEMGSPATRIVRPTRQETKKTIHTLIR